MATWTSWPFFHGDVYILYQFCYGVKRRRYVFIDVASFCDIVKVSRSFLGHSTATGRPPDAGRSGVFDRLLDEEQDEAVTLWHICSTSLLRAGQARV